MYQQITSNKRKTVLLIGGFIAFMAAFGWVLSRALGDPSLLLSVSVFAIVYSLVSYFAAAKVALALARAQAVTKAETPELYGWWRISQSPPVTDAAGLYC